MSFPVTRPSGRALLVGNPASRGQTLALLSLLGFGCEEVDDPYTALCEICMRPHDFHAVVLSLASLYREELQVISTLRARFPEIEVWLAQTDGRHAAMAESIRLGADGLLSEDGLHRIGIAPAAAAADHAAADHRGAHHADDTMVTLTRESNGESEPPSQRSDSNGSRTSEPSSNGNGNGNGDGEDQESGVGLGEPVLSADELRALLQEQPFSPPRADG